jgi:hypothetical protein
VPVSEPLDLDGDGIDDVFELRHPQALDPLDPSDAEKDYDGDGLSNRTEYQQGSDPLAPAGGWTVYVVDDPPAGSTDRFRTLAEAVAALDARLPAGQTGQVRVGTGRVQEVEVLELGGDIELLAEAGYEGRIALVGPGVAPLVVRSAGALSLRGWSIANAGGVRVEAGRRLSWQGNHGPGATLVVGHGSPSRVLAARPHGGTASSLLVGDSTFSGPLRVNWFGDGGAGATLGITANSATVIEASVHGLFGGSAEVRGNLTTDLALSFEALGAAQVVVANHANLEHLRFSGTSQANPTLQFQSVFATSFNLELAGVGSFFTSLDLLTSKSVTVNVGAANTDLQARDLVADDLILNLSASGGPAPRLRHSQRNVNVRHGIRVRDCTFAGQGLAISDAGGEATVQRVQVQHAGGGMPALGISGSSAVVEDVTVAGTPLIGLALNLTGSATVKRIDLGVGGLSIGGGQVQLEELHSQGIVTLTGGRVQARNSQLGSVITIVGNAVLGFEDCTLGGVMILDMNESGGLLSDPVNQGANPEEVYSSIDFDNDQLHCADYPPPQTRPDTGDCIRSGVPPPQ